MTSSPDTTSPVDGVEPDTRTGRFPGWWVVTGCFLVLMVNSGLAFYGLAVAVGCGFDAAAVTEVSKVFFEQRCERRAAQRSVIEVSPERDDEPHGRFGLCGGDGERSEELMA